MKINIEGWNGVLQSYSMVAESYAKCLMCIPDTQLFFTEKPYYIPTWKKSRASLFDKLTPPTEMVDITIRFVYPYDYTPSPQSRHTIVFVTSEFSILTYVPPGPLILPKNVWIMTPSQFSKNGIIRTGYDPNKIFVVPHCCEYTEVKLTKEQLRKKYKLPIDCFIFYHNSTMSQNKNIAYVMLCFKKLCEKYKHIILLLKGMDATFQSKQKVDGIANELGSGEYIDKIIYLGEDVSNEVMAELYELSDCYVAPFLAEGFNLPVLESLCHGLNVICTQGGPPDEFARDALFIKSIVFPTANKVVVNGQVRYQDKLTPNLAHLFELMEHMIKTDERYDNDIIRHQKKHIDRKYYINKFSYVSIGQILKNELHKFTQ